MLIALILLASAAASGAYDPPEMRKEAEGDSKYPGCNLEANLTGTCENYRWFNLCSGYIWVYSGWDTGETVGVQFGGQDEQPCVWALSCTGPYQARRVITYYRDVVPYYGNTVDVELELDLDGDGVGEGVVESYPAIDPGERWNCTELTNGCTYSLYLIVKQVHGEGVAPAFATDGPMTEECGEPEMQRSFYYGTNGSTVIPWTGPTGRADNFLIWLVVDDLTATGVAMPPQESSSWGGIKALYR